ATGTVTGARLLQAGAPTIAAAVAGAAAGALAGWLVGGLFARLPRAGIAAATWVVSWLAAFALQSISWFLGGTQGLVVTRGPTQYGPYLSFKLFVVVLVGGALAPLGAAAGVVVLAVLSVAADAIGSLEHVAAARSHTLLAAVMLLGIVSLGWDGIVRPARRRW